MFTAVVRRPAPNGYLVSGLAHRPGSRRPLTRPSGTLSPLPRGEGGSAINQRVANRRLSLYSRMTKSRAVLRKDLAATGL